MLYIHIALSFLAVIFFVKSNLQNNFLRLFFITFIFININLLGIYYFFNFLSGDGLNEAVIFHLVHGISGFGIDEYIIPGILLFLYFLSSVIICIFLFTNRNLNFFYSEKLVITAPIFIIFFFTSLVLNPLLNDIKNIFFSNNINSISENSYYDNSDIKFIKKSKNIIFLYLEQFEKTYTDNSLFPGLTPHLNNLEKKATSFTNIESPMGTNWTIAGMVASQCGIPLLTNIEVANNMGGMDKFLVSARCIGDVLNEKSYDLNYINGSNLEFAGKGKFYESHGFNKVEGWDELRHRLIDSSYRSPWGLYDDSLYEINIDRLNQLRNTNRPYGLFTLTLDTHHPNGYLSSACKDMLYEDGKNPILNAIHCADYMAAQFIEEIINHESFKNTVLVVLSDHLALKNTATPILKNIDRKNLFYIFAENAPQRKITKPGTMFDVAPTVLSIMGANTTGFGLGRNLLIEDSLIEDSDGMNKVIEDTRSQIVSFWSFPKLKNGFEILPDQKKIIFGTRYVNLPALILLDDNNDTQEIIFDFHYAKPLEKRVAELKDYQKYIWVDSCQKISPSMLASENEELNYCSIAAIKNKKKYLIYKNLEAVNKEMIFDFFNKNKKSFFDN